MREVISMKRLMSIAGALLVGFLLLVPAVLAADPLPHTGRVIMSTEGDVTIPAGEHADVVIVVNGTATIQGEVNTIVAVDGAATLLGGRTETIVAVRSPVEIGPGSVVLGDVMTVESLVHRTGDGAVQGQVTDAATALIGIGAVLGGALFLIWIGFGLAMVVAGMLLAGLASRQVREAETLISREPALTLGVGIVGLFAFPLVAILLMVTVIGAPLGVGILLQVWPLVAFLSYLIGGIWIGDWILRQTSPERVRERPYLAAVLGVLLLEVVALVPILALVAMIASLFGFGAVLRLALRTLRSRSVPRPTVAGPMPAPMAG
jgi:hypothetical protein